MRIFLGPRDIAGQIPLLAKGFRSLGCDVTTCCYENAQYKYNPDLKYDMFIQPGDMHQVNKIIEEHDVFIFLYGTSLLPDNRDFEILRKAGKKIISFCLGSDIRSWHAFEQQFALNVVEKENFPTGSLIYTLQASATLRRAELYADLILSLPNQSSLALRPYNNAFIAIDIPKFKFNVPERDVPMVVHAPTNRGMKGTDLILKALNELKQEGVNFELRLMEGYHNNQVLDILSDADCAIDQAILGFGLFSAEAMASGCAVAGAYYPHLEAIETLRPAQGLHINTLKENLRTLLVNSRC